MKKKDCLIVVLAMVFSLFLVSYVNAGWFSKSRTEKAQEFIAARMFDKAIEVLEEEINKNPTNAEAHFQLGILYIHKRSFNRAEERFESAYALNSRYGPKIGRVFQRSGDMYLRRTFISRAIGYYRKALRYNPKLKDIITERCYQKIIFLLSPFRCCSASAEKLATFINAYTSNYKEKIKEAQIAYARKCLQIAKNRPKNKRQPYLKEAKKYLTQKEINKVIPPPSWKTVFAKEYIGVGFTGGDDPKYNDGGIKTVKFGKDYVFGDKSIITGKIFEVWDNGWKKYNKIRIHINTTTNTGGFLTIRAPKGVKFTVEIQRLMEIS